MSDPTRILIVEDSSTDADLASREIRKALTACVFEYVETREAFLTALETFRPDLVVSDYNMPHFDGDGGVETDISAHATDASDHLDGFAK